MMAEQQQLMTTEIIKYTLADASKIDKEMRQLVGAYSAAKIKVGLEMGKRLSEVENNKLYLKLDSQAYPTFHRYLESLNINYKTAREVIGLYETYVVAAGISIDELVQFSYAKLAVLKPKFFDKVDGQYILAGPKTELQKWLSDASSDITIEDFKQKVREEEAGEHEHQFEIIKQRVCKVCKLKERI